MKKIFSLSIALALCSCAFAQTAPSVDKAPIAQHLKFYGFVRTYFAFDTRESTAGTEDLYFYMPKPVSPDATGADANAIPSFRFAALTSRFGLDIVGYEIGEYKIGGKIEADFYAGVSGVTGTAQFRLRQAFVTVARDDRSWKVGQAWHPMAADLPDIFSLESGVPFTAFSRTPQISFEWNFAGPWSLSASALWQMQYTSTGPKLTQQSDGTYKYVATASADYIKYGCTPEVYLAFNFKKGPAVFRAGADIVSIKPRNFNYDLASGKTLNKVKDRLTTWNAYVYAQDRFGEWDWKAKMIYANDGSHFNMVGGYGQSGAFDDGSWSYTASRNLSAWTTFSRKSKNTRWVPQIFLGYCKTFGTPEEVTGGFWGKNNAGLLDQLWRIQPEILYNLGKLQFGLEYMMTAAQYGKSDSHKRVVSGFSVVANHRIQALIKYTF